MVGFRYSIVVITCVQLLWLTPLRNQHPYLVGCCKISNFIFCSRKIPIRGYCQKICGHYCMGLSTSLDSSQLLFSLQLSLLFHQGLLSHLTLSFFMVRYKVFQAQHSLLTFPFTGMQWWNRESWKLLWHSQDIFGGSETSELSIIFSAYQMKIEQIWLHGCSGSVVCMKVDSGKLQFSNDQPLAFVFWCV